MQPDYVDICGEKAVKIMELPQLGLLEISGKDAARFLQGQLTCDVNEVDEANTRLGAHCTPKGRIVATFRIARRAESFYLLLPRSMIERLQTTLQKYVKFFKASLTDLSSTWQSLGLEGFTDQIPFPTESNGAITSEEGFIIRVPGRSRFLIVGEKDWIAQQRTALLNSAQLVDSEHWMVLDIEAGFPSILPETQDMFTPHDLSYPDLGGISFTKGCYTGQEIIARMQYLGKPKQKLYRVSIAGDPPTPGTTLYSGDQEVGTIVIAYRVSAAGSEGLAVLRNEVVLEKKGVYTEEGHAVKV